MDEGRPNTDVDIKTLIELIVRALVDHPDQVRVTQLDGTNSVVLELAVDADAPTIVTFNTRDFVGSERFGIRVVTPREYLQEIGEIP